MYSQRVVERGYARALDRAIRNDTVVAMTAIDSTSVRENDADLFYAQAHSMVRFLIESQGEPKFRQFIAALNSKKTDEAMQAVYGFDKNAFEDAWRENIGLPKREPQTPNATTSNAPVILTVEPLTNPATSSAAQPTDGDASLPVLPVAAGAGVVVAVLSLAGLLLIRRRRAST
jgi:hypothetical protein